MFIYYIFGINTVVVLNILILYMRPRNNMFWCVFLAPRVFIVLYFGT